jgi:hypothetical protein
MSLRCEYIPVGFSPTSLLSKVLKNPPSPDVPGTDRFTSDTMGVHDG